MSNRGQGNSRLYALPFIGFLAGVVLTAILAIIVYNIWSRATSDQGSSIVEPTAIAAVTPMPAVEVTPTSLTAPEETTMPTPVLQITAEIPDPTLAPTVIAQGDICQNPTISCTELGSSWAGGTANCRQDGNGYDTSTCSLAASQLFEVVKPALRDPGQWESARCNDGTPFGFQVRLAAEPSATWVFILEGGGWCDDTSKNCFGRTPELTSSPVDEDRDFVEIGKSGIFNQSAAENPTFYNANHVYAPYCSSDLWSGATSERRPTAAVAEGLYFSGRLNIQAMLEALMQHYGLDNSNPETRILFGGTSAGGIGVEVNADTLVKLLPQAAAGGRLKLVNDGGFLLDFDDPAYRLAPATVPVQTLLEQNYDLWGSSLNSLCEQAMANAGAHPGSCFMTTVVHPYIVNPPPGGLGLPLFIQVSTIDVPATQGHGIDNPSDPNDVAALETWRAQTLASLQGIEWVFSVGRPYHTLLTRDDSRNGWNMGPRGNTFREVLTRFWEGSSPERAVFMNPGP